MLGSELTSLHEQALCTQVRVIAGNAGGSGTVIWSEPDGEGYHSTYILTCHHVVEGAIKVETKWDSVLGRDRKMDFRDPVTVEFFDWEALPHGNAPLTSGVKAEIMAYNSLDDMALLHMRLRDKAPFVARLLSQARIKSVHVGSPNVAVGCALLHPPVLTKGAVTGMGDIIEYRDYWLSSAQTIFGNSGGGVFVGPLDDGYFFIGIPSRIAVNISGFSANAITHMGYFSPISRIYKFFDDQIYSFLVPGSKETEATCELARKKRKEEDEKRMMFR